MSEKWTSRGVEIKTGKEFHNHIFPVYSVEMAKRVVTAVNNYKPLVKALRRCAEGHCHCPVLVADLEALGLDYKREHCEARALLADIDKEKSANDL